MYGGVIAILESIYKLISYNLIFFSFLDGLRMYKKKINNKHGVFNKKKKKKRRLLIFEIT